MAGSQEEYDEERYSEGEEEYESEEGDYDEEQDGEVAEVVDEDEGEEGEEEEGEQQGASPGGAGGPGGQGPMIHVPGLGTFPASQLGLTPQQLRSLLGGRNAPPGPPPDKQWEGLDKMPDATQDALHELLGMLHDEGRSELTVLLLGRGGAGKTSTLNSLLGERCGAPSALQPSASGPAAYTRRVATGPDAEFAITVIDTPTIVAQDIISNQRVLSVVEAVQGRQVDVVLFVDRLDTYKDDLIDERLIRALTEALGGRLWDNAVLALTRSSEGAQPPGVDFHDHVAKRAQQLRRLIRKAGGAKHAELPLALVENSSRCPVDDEGQKIVPGEVPWLVDLYEKAAELALNVPPYEYDAKAARRGGSDRRALWLIPLLLAAQLGARLLLERVQEDDACHGDDSGPFDAATVEERRARIRRDKDRKRRMADRKKAKARGEIVWASDDE